MPCVEGLLASLERVQQRPVQQRYFLAFLGGNAIRFRRSDYYSTHLAPIYGPACSWGGGVPSSVGRDAGRCAALDEYVLLHYALDGICSPTQGLCLLHG